MASTSGMEVAGGERRGRLMIAQMVLENFKSYGGERTIGPFHKRFSSVVGPNGSGKSNVIDAMQFVMGKRASRMRLKKVSELIHKSENYPACEYAKVSVYFQDIVDTGPGDEDYTVVDGSQVVVTRVAYATNGSKYFLNDKSSSYSEVTALLRERGIDLDHNRSMVLQGEIEQIAMMKPKGTGDNDSGLLEFLEDIIGSNTFVEDINAAGKATEELNEERTSHLHRVKVVEKERLALESSKLEAEAYMAKELELCTHRFHLYQLNRAQTAVQAEALREKATVVDGEYATLQKALSSTTTALAATEAQFSRIQTEHKDVESALDAAKREFEAYERKDVKFREDVKHCKTKIKKNAKAGVTAAAKVEQCKANLARAETDAADAAAALETHTAAAAKHSEALEELNAQLASVTAEFQAEIEEAQKAAMPHVEASAQHKAALDLAASQAALINDRVAKAAAALAKATAELESYASTADAKAEKLAALQAKLAEASAEATQIANDLAQAGAMEAELAKDVAALRSTLEESRSSLQAANSRSAVLDELLALKAAGKLPGVLGRLGDLGVIDEAYDVAVSTAAPALNNIVVDTPETGAKAVAYLRKHNLGRATFIILSELGYLAKYMASAAASFPAPRLFDLITPSSPEVAPAFFYATKNTLVADSLDAATSVAFAGDRRFRVVTLDGQLIDTSGTMSGGGSRASSGAMLTSATASSASAAAAAAAAASVVSAADVAAAEAELKTKSSQLAALRAEMESLKRRSYKVATKVSTLETSISKLEMDLAASTAAEPVLKAQIEAHTAAAALTPEEKTQLAALEATMATEQAALDETKLVLDAFDAEIKILQEKILEAGGMELRKAQSARDSAQQQADLAASAATKAKVAIKSATKALAKAEAALAGLETESADLAASLATMEAEFATLETEAVAVLESYKQTQLLMEEKEEELAGLKNVYDDQKKTYNALQAQEVDITDRRDELARTIADYDRRIADWSTKMEAVQAQYASSLGLISSPTQLAELQNKTGAGMDLASDDDESDNEAEANNDDAGDESGDDASGAAPASGVLRELSAKKLAKVDKAELEAEIGLLEEAIKEMSPNLRAIQMYREKEEEYLTKVTALDEITEKRDAARDVFDSLRKQRLDKFMAGFSTITLKLKEMYQMITMGGDAELELVDSLDPFSEGIVFSVRPPKKSWKNISNLSGGEKTLSSLALVFALHHYKPTPLYVMDEIDAALDFRNVSIVANYIKDRTKDAQFIVISLRNNMFELADRLVGVYKTNNVTKSVTLNPRAVALGLGERK
ncbi:SMC4 protein [Thecamonas trahens ATCC 50062]|uniref:Structural maintenance of chromosomes protein n=1 Tax=Thecamonas trahens ATCC 50062 TaxID=461836 RepID=A0A0L0DLI9_THETB|nr:SMC4 protein [Thecamonas trahens ATCC 50062]KNC53172.1 SMC4 protein [Thecamonas trahens ATCC 50062]|eukprot:XP_013754645.1 SMC4 protein [Thecamonas trahens ATCC 50062]